MTPVTSSQVSNHPDDVVYLTTAQQSDRALLVLIICISVVINVCCSPDSLHLVSVYIIKHNLGYKCKLFVQPLWFDQDG